MNLLEVRTQFVKISGRYDLVLSNTDFTDNGADYYINLAQKSLERRLGSSLVKGKIYDSLTIGQYLFSFKNCRAIKNVWIISSEGRTKLEKIDDSDMRDVDSSSPLSTMTKNIPSHYYPTTKRNPEDNDGSGDSANLLQFVDVDVPYDPDYKSIIIYPPPDLAYDIEIEGLFYSLKLENDTDENFWTNNHSDLLLMAALRHIGIFYKGGKTEESWDSIINKEIANIDKDMVEQEIADIEKTEE